MDNTTPRTDPRVLRTRQMLREAVIDMMEEMSIEKITVNKIAERAKINRVTFYLHYRDIPDMLEKMADDMAEEVMQVVSSYTDNPDASENEKWPMLERLLGHIAGNAKFYKVVLTSRRSTIFSDRLFRLMAGIISDRVDKGRADSVTSNTVVQRDIAVWYGSAALIGTIIAWLREDMPYTPQYMAKQIALLRAN
ncbi:TetR/AcrR family transcriptional regulator C-terminal domain-containing protein [Paenibacillus sp. MMS20-IR301]|uniref:TetR/AcrR family transcriptional regulator n=1 Tax=Paenibacillus sp. MMS20-IR301 TaxID=2895946 RepID=UPI0028E9713B|nr:TetR/AcrR family transcriptional regulator C-terminal domain-containing protein [Paenibacillus sp. MMS20-IR301]WNS40679.1 TetR/AcrR family transcriptional regulator C-terminal domain-containing protein [Paenibacillus sp. MMS20-IR301]